MHHAISVGTDGRAISRMLSRVFGKASVGCIVRNGGVILAGGDEDTRSGASALRRVTAMEKGIASSGNRPVVNTGVLRGKATGNIVAGARKRFDVGVPPCTAVIMSCVDCRPRAVTLGNEGGLRVQVRRGDLTLRRMIMATVNVRGGVSSLACSARRVDDDRLAHTGRPGVVGALTKGATKMRVGGATGLKNSTGIIVHNTHSTFTDNGGRPLCMVSNIPVLGDSARSASAMVNNGCSKLGHSTNSKVSGLGPSSVRDVGVLGNSSTTTLCNSRTTGNIVLVAAGGKGTKLRHIAFSSGLAMDRTVDAPRFRGACNQGRSNNATD